MTCQELHAYCKMHPAAVVPLQLDSSELSQHLASCSDCSRFLEQEKEVSEYLLLVRDAAPAISASLEASGRDRWAISTAALGAVAAMAFAAAVAYAAMLLLFPRQAIRIDPKRTEQRVTVVAPGALPVRKEIVAGEPVPKEPTTATARRKNRPTGTTGQNDRFPIKFQGLLYCDSFSCSGSMDVIRVQLSSPTFGTTPASGQGVVSADVLVGPDGIARGIRVVE
jgi:hypothetical protein